MKQLSVFLILAFTSAVLFWAVLKTDEKLQKSKYTQCGKIIHMKTGFDIVTHRTKHSHYDELANVNILVVNYDGSIVSEEVGDNIYYRHKTGDRICFNRESDFWGFSLWVIGIAFSIAAYNTLCALYKLIFG